MKKLILIFLLSVCSFKGTVVNIHAQVGIVNDPLHMASNLIGFVEGLSEAVTTTSKIVQQIAFADSMAKMAKKGIDFLQKIDKEIRTVTGIADLSISFYNTTLAMERTLDKIKKGKRLTIPEMTDILNDYTSYLNAATSSVNTISRLLKEEAIVANYYERQKLLEDEKKKLDEATRKAQDAFLRAGLKADHRAAMEQLLTTIDNYNPSLFITNNLDPDQTEMSYAAAAAIAIRNIEKAFGEDERQTEQAAKNALKRQFEPYANIFYAISGVIGLLAALRIYGKINLGEPMDKLIAIFMGATILLALLPSFINLLFF